MLDNRVLAALDQSSLPAFLPYSSRLSHQEPSAKAHGLERAPLDQREPHHFACLLICRRAWPASSGCPSTGFSQATCSRSGRALTQPALTALPCRETENLSTSYIRSILHQQDRLVKPLGLSPDRGVFVYRKG
jgi:hypothetical protein